MLILPGAVVREGVFSLTTTVVRFDGFGLDDDGGVAFLPSLRTGRDGPRDVAGTQSQSRRQCREGGDKDGDDYFCNFFLSHFSRSSV